MTSVRPNDLTTNQLLKIPLQNLLNILRTLDEGYVNRIWIDKFVTKKYRPDVKLWIAHQKLSPNLTNEDKNIIKNNIISYLLNNLPKFSTNNIEIRAIEDLNQLINKYSNFNVAAEDQKLENIDTDVEVKSTVSTVKSNVSKKIPRKKSVEVVPKSKPKSKPKPKESHIIDKQQTKRKQAQTQTSKMINKDINPRESENKKRLKKQIENENEISKSILMKEYNDLMRERFNLDEMQRNLSYDDPDEEDILLFIGERIDDIEKKLSNLYLTHGTTQFKTDGDLIYPSPSQRQHDRGLELIRNAMKNDAQFVTGAQRHQLSNLEQLDETKQEIATEIKIINELNNDINNIRDIRDQPTTTLPLEPFETITAPVPSSPFEESLNQLLNDHEHHENELKRLNVIEMNLLDDIIQDEKEINRVIYNEKHLAEQLLLEHEQEQQSEMQQLLYEQERDRYNYMENLRQEEEKKRLDELELQRTRETERLISMQQRFKDMEMKRKEEYNEYVRSQRSERQREQREQSEQQGQLLSNENQKIEEDERLKAIRSNILANRLKRLPYVESSLDITSSDKINYLLKILQQMVRDKTSIRLESTNPYNDVDTLMAQIVAINFNSSPKNILVRINPSNAQEIQGTMVLTQSVNSPLIWVSKNEVWRLNLEDYIDINEFLFLGTSPTPTY